MRKNKQKPHSVAETDFYAEALSAMNAHSLKEKKNGLLYGLLSVAAVVAVVLLLWQPWKEGDIDPTQSSVSTGTVTEQPASDFDSIQFFLWETQEQVEDEIYAVSSSNRLALDIDAGQVLVDDLGDLKWYDMVQLKKDLPLIGEFELIVDGISYIYGFTATGVITYEGSYATLGASMWMQLFNLMHDAGSEPQTYEFLGVHESGRLWNQLHLQIEEGGTYTLRENARDRMQGSFAWIGDYLLLGQVVDSAYGFLTLRLDAEGGLTVYEANSSPIMVEKMRLKTDQKLYPKNEKHYTFLRVSLRGAILSEYPSAILDKGQYDSVLAALNQHTWQDANPDEYRGHDYADVILGPLHSEDRMDLRLCSGGVVYSLREEKKTVLSKEDWLSLVKILCSIGNDMGLGSYEALESPSKATLAFEEECCFTYLEGDTIVGKGVYLCVDSVVMLAFEDTTLWILQYAEYSTGYGLEDLHGNHFCKQSS